MALHTHFDDRDANVECPACDELEDRAGGREGPDQPFPTGGGHDDYDHLRESADQASDANLADWYNAGDDGVLPEIRFRESGGRAR